MPMTDAETVTVHLADWFHADPTLGVTSIDRDLTIRFVNRRALGLFLGREAPLNGGERLSDLFPEDWVRDRADVIERALRERQPIVLRSINRGKRVQSTFHPVCDNGDAPDRVLVFSTPCQGDIEETSFPVVEARVVDLGELSRLTQRELEVLAYVGQGLRREAIAEALHRSPKTIDHHLASLSGKLRVNSRGRLVAIALEAGLKPEHAHAPRTKMSS